jgi:acetyl-CoA acetyltransferase family protein
MRQPEGREVVIVEAVRTPIGRGHKEKGYYKDTHPNELLGRCYTEVISRAGIDAAEVEDVVAGCVQQFGEQGFNIARNAWLQEGLPIETPGTTVDRQCGSAQQAVNFSAALIAAGVHDAMIGSGVEHMGHLPFAAGMKTQEDFGYAFTPELMAKHNIVGQGLGAEMIADQWEIPRSELDELAVRSHRLAHQATEEGRFEREIVPMSVNGDTFVADQGIRPDTSLEALSQLKPVFKADGKITAGNASQISDGAAAVLLMAAEKAKALGLTPRARIVDQTTVGTDPVKMLEGPIPATRKILDRNGMTIDDIDLFEINEAFAPVVAAWRREHNPDMDRVNVNGGAMALGHPLGSTGARLITTLLHELERSDKEIGFVTMCCGGGLGTGTLIQGASPPSLILGPPGPGPGRRGRACAPPVQAACGLGFAQPLGPPPVQLTTTGGSASSTAQVAASVLPLGGIAWAAWNVRRSLVVCEPKVPVVSCAGTALARCSCIHSTWSPLAPLESSGLVAFGVTLVSGASAAARVLQPLAGVSCQSQNEVPVAP